MFYICIAQGLADCTPDRQDYHCGPQEEITAIVTAACDEFAREETEGQDNPAPYRYEYRAPHGEYNTNWSQRLCISRAHDYVLDVIGMTADDYAREQGEEA